MMGLGSHLDIQTEGKVRLVFSAPTTSLDEMVCLEQSVGSKIYLNFTNKVKHFFSPENTSTH